MADVIHTTDELGISSFPDPVEQFLSTISLNSPGLHDEIESRFANSGLDRIEAKQLKKLAKTVRQDSGLTSGQHSDPNGNMAPDERVATQIIGTLSTFIQQREKIGLPSQSHLQENGRKIRLNVATMAGGNSLYLLYPGDKAFWNSRYDHPFDFQVFLEGYNGRGDEKEMPGHNDLFSDLWWKLKEAHLSRQSTKLVDEWKHGMAELYCGNSPDEILRDYSNLDDFTVGRIPRVLLQATYWIFLQEDLNYPRPRFDGREYTYNPVARILDSIRSSFGANSANYGGPQDSEKYARYHEVMDDIRNHDGQLIPNSVLQSDTYSL
ncbi:hypothetical protein VB779_03175 [Haloarculaceae archaeon H-GB11]|nr:hypothetical protein [Haloarculaceae archaeon H-GB11]